MRLVGFRERSKGIPLFRSPLVHFLLIGALLYALQSTQSLVSEPIVVEVLRSEILGRIVAYQSQTGREASSVEARSIENQIIEDALWIEQARALGLHKTDSVVRQRLVLNMRFLEGQSDSPEEELFQKAVALGMDRSDTVVQRRLIDRVQAMIRAGVRSRTPDEAVLRAHYESTAPRWREPAVLDFSHVYFSRDKRGERAKRDAVRALPDLAEQGLEPHAAVALADPFLSGHRVPGATPNRIVARFGPVFAAQLEDAPTQSWVGPIESAFGAHLVWIHDRIESRIPGFDAIRNRVHEDWIAEETRKALRVQIERRRQIVEVRVIEDQEASRETIARAADE
jgi:hypothetical protein